MWRVRVVVVVGKSVCVMMFDGPDRAMDTMKRILQGLTCDDRVHLARRIYGNKVRNLEG
jgi:hypothetical protein